MNTTLLKIGDLARRTGLTVEALRFYEKQELLKPSVRSDSGYRLYSEEDCKRVVFILHAKKVGFTLGEIKTLLGLSLHKEDHTCEEVKAYTGEKISEVERRISDLQVILNALKELHGACCGGKEKATHCSILSSLEEDFFVAERD